LWKVEGGEGRVDLLCATDLAYYGGLLFTTSNNLTLALTLTLTLLITTINHNNVNPILYL